MPLTSPNMGLKIWTNYPDRYDHDQLAGNFAKIDYHDHTPGRGIQIPTEAIFDGAVNYTKLSRQTLQSQTLALASTAAGATTTVTVTWATPWADVNYAVFAHVTAPTTSLVRVINVTKTTTQATFEVRNDGGSAITGTLNVLGVHT